MSNVVLEMEHITKRFPGVTALNDICVKIYYGEILAVCGENGAGKSTLMKILSGMYTSGEYDGNILVDNKKVDITSVSHSQNLGIEMVYQEQNMMLDSNIAENLYVGNLPGRNGIVDYKKLYKETEEQLKRVKLELEPKQLVRPLNSGQTQLLSILRGVVKNPKILVLDEPTSALSDAEVDVLMDLITQLKKSGVSIIFISHKLEEVYRISDRIITMRDGKFIAEHKTSEVREDELIEEMVGRKIESVYPIKNKPGDENVLRVENLSVPHPTIPQKNIVENINFTLKKGEILGIGGLVGAGRSEILGAIFGSITDGVNKKLYIDGKEIVINSPSDAIAHGIGFLTEERKRSGYVGTMSIKENLTLVCLRKLPGKFFINGKIEKETAEKIFGNLRVKAPSIKTSVINLSGGNQQKVVLGKWLLEQPDILLIDEPTKGIDIGAKSEIYKILNDLTKKGVSIILVSSDMPELVSMSNRCLVLSNGRISGELKGDEITQDNVMKLALA